MTFWETPKAEKDKLIKKVFNLIDQYQMEVPAVLLLETIKPLATVGGSILRMALSPFMIFFWNEGNAVLDTFEDKRNIDQLIKMIEDRNRETREAEQERKKREPKVEKKSWRRFIPF